MRPAIFVGVSSGLGNQMFQYAAGRAMSVRTGLPLMLDLDWFSRPSGQVTPRRYGLDVFSLAGEIATREQIVAVRQNLLERRFGLVPLTEVITFFREPYRRYWPEIAAINGPAYLDGYWQSPRYFDPAPDVIRQDFAFPPLPSEAARELAAAMVTAPGAVAIHVRRTDYIDGAFSFRFANCCPPEYYSAALEQLEARASDPLTLFLFSDDPVWVRANFDTRGHAATVVDFPEHREAPHHDMHLMSLARHHIIANSTFSWWGAWLASRPGQSVTAPRRWFANLDENRAFGTADRYLPGWTVV
ncbi:MAG: alpha-1,2-fucosyltransferase [Bauldia sp.]